jgi:hypothetical protein
MRTYVELLRLLSTLAPTMASEMAQALPPRSDCAALPGMPDASLKALVDRAESAVAGLLEASGTKRADARVVLSPDHSELLAAAPADEVARWLKVDGASSGQVDSVSSAVEPTCPRCRLHAWPTDVGWCAPCRDVVRDAMAGGPDATGPN